MLIRYGVAASGEIRRCRMGRPPSGATVWATMNRGKPKPRETARSLGCGARSGDVATAGWTLASLIRPATPRRPSLVYAVLRSAREAAPVVVSPRWAAVKVLLRILLAWSTVSGAEVVFAFGGSGMPSKA